uniref:Uncharacterized protein n=1 Tax=Oryza punctata TaxID=4537 RepID=A0A0E0L5A5_ORYPU
MEVNIRAQDDDQAKKRLYFAELKLNPDLLAKRIQRSAELSLDPKIVGCADDIEPMCVVSIHNLQGWSGVAYQPHVHASSSSAAAAALRLWSSADDDVVAALPAGAEVIAFAN